MIDTMFDPTVTFDDLAWIKDQWPGKLVVKGVQNLDDACRLTSMGVDGILLSNHGGRQLDRAPIPFHLLPDVVREVGKDTEILLDVTQLDPPTVKQCDAQHGNAIQACAGWVMTAQSDHPAVTVVYGVEDHRRSCSVALWCRNESGDAVQEFRHTTTGFSGDPEDITHCPEWT